MQLRHFLLLVTISYVISCVASQPTPSEDFAHQAILDRNENVWLYWTVEDIYITFEVHGRTTGWVGVGISPNGGMIGADMFVGWVKDGVPSITDRHGLLSSNTFPPQDEQQDLTLLGGNEQDGWTRIKFRRQIAGCEENEDITFTTSTARIIWALGSTDPEGDDITRSNYHGGGSENRGQRSLLILEAGREAKTIVEEDTEDFSFLIDQFQIPARQTYYNCKLIEFPQFPSKRHVISIEPVVQPGNENNVHHILLYQCSEDVMNASNINRSHECFTANMPDDFESCRLVIHAWAIGGQALNYPAHVGFALGTDDAPRYAVMEVHYDNPELTPGIVDSSGLKFVYTSQLRQYDVGILETGRVVFPFSHLIPPNAENFVTYGECPSGCIAPGMEHIGRNDIRIFGTLLHSHLLGRKITLHHIAANGTTELPVIAQDNAYDFNYQEVKIFSEEVTFRLGESLQTTCSYNSLGKRNFTLGGLGTPQEMCLAYAFYYPKIPVTSCTTSPIPSLQLRHFGIFNTTYIRRPSLRGTLDDQIVLEPEQLANQSLGNVLNSIEWNQSLAESLSNFERNLFRIHRCLALVDLELATYGFPPRITQPYRAPSPQCVSPTTPQPVKTTSSGHMLRYCLSLLIISCLSLMTSL